MDRWTVVLRRTDQTAVAVIIAVCLGLIASRWIYEGGMRGRLIEIEQGQLSSPAIVHFQLDVNQAGWPELTTLPGVSETLARRIVETRDTTGPYQSAEDLARVNGIGPKSIERIRPFLLPFESTATR